MNTLNYECNGIFQKLMFPVKPAPTGSGGQRRYSMEDKLRVLRSRRFGEPRASLARRTGVTTATLAAWGKELGAVGAKVPPTPAKLTARLTHIDRKLKWYRAERRAVQRLLGMVAADARAQGPQFETTPILERSCA